jgi:hypothetical protein
MAVIKHTALNLLSSAKPTISLKNRRKRADWNADYLAALLRGKKSSEHSPMDIPVLGCWNELDPMIQMPQRRPYASRTASFASGAYSPCRCWRNA